MTDPTARPRADGMNHKFPRSPGKGEWCPRANAICKDHDCAASSACVMLSPLAFEDARLRAMINRLQHDNAQLRAEALEAVAEIERIRMALRNLLRLADAAKRGAGHIMNEAIVLDDPMFDDSPFQIARAALAPKENN